MNFSKVLIVLMSISLIAFAQVKELPKPDIIEVGKISKGGIIEGNIEFVNTTDDIIEIAEIKPSCGCTAINPDKLVYASGESVSIPYSIDTEKFSGVIQKSITISFKDNNPKKQTFFVRANVVTDLTVSPRFVNFQNVPQNPDTVISEFFELENESDSPIEITSIRVENEFIKVIPESVVIPAGKSHLVRLEFTPSKVGRHNAKVLIDVNHPTEKEKKLPVFANVNEVMLEGSR